MNRETLRREALGAERPAGPWGRRVASGAGGGVESEGQVSLPLHLTSHRYFGRRAADVATTGAS